MLLKRFCAIRRRLPPLGSGDVSFSPEVIPMV